MSPPLSRVFYSVLLFFTLLYSTPSPAVEVFGKGSVSRSYLASDNSTMSVSMTAGLAFGLLSFLRIEGRYTNISSLQDKLDVVSQSVIGTLTNIMTETSIYSVGVDIDLAGETASFQPYVYLGCGYVSMTRSYYFTMAGNSAATYFSEPSENGVSVNGGLGFRVRIARTLAIEIEAYAYATDVSQPNPLINWYGTAGLRIFI